MKQPDTKADGCGLRERITQANSAEAINDLLVIGTQFDNASDRTRRAWAATAKRRNAQLKGSK